MPISPSNEQLDAIEYPNNKVITARPGSGKTFILAQMIVKDSVDLLSYQGIVAISYTRKASAELKNRCIRYGATRNKSFYGTIDSFCLNEVVSPYLSRYPGASSSLDVIDSDNDYDTLSTNDKKQKVNQALKSGILPINMACSAALQILNSVPAAEDYIKARYRSVYVDEYQDCGEPQHNLVMKLSSLGLKTVVVGDLDQAVFGWTYKSSGYLCRLLKSPDFERFELTENYRCHPSIISYSRRLLGYDDSYTPESGTTKNFRVIRVQVVPANSNNTRDYTDEKSIICALSQYLDGIKKRYGINDNNDIAILARSNATLNRCANAASSFNLPFKLHRDSPLDTKFSAWGNLFVRLLETYYSHESYAFDFVDMYISPYSNARTRIRAVDLLSDYLSLRPESLRKRIDLAVQIARLCEPSAYREVDVETYRSMVSDVDKLKAYYTPPAPNEINLLTYHKAKGLEFDAVVCLDTYDTIFPAPQRDHPYDVYKETLSLHYVGITRARKVCYIPTATHRYDRFRKLVRAKPSPFLELNNVKQLRRDVQWEV